MFPTRRNFLFAGGAWLQRLDFIWSDARRRARAQGVRAETTRIRLARGPSLLRHAAVRR